VDAMSAVQESAGGWLGWKRTRQVRFEPKWCPLMNTSPPQFGAHSFFGLPSSSTDRPTAGASSVPQRSFRHPVHQRYCHCAKKWRVQA